jgi:hypothetical protein
MLRVEQVVTLDPRLAPQLDHVAAPIEMHLQIFHHDILYCRRARDGLDLESEGLKPFDGNIVGAARRKVTLKGGHNLTFSCCWLGQYRYAGGCRAAAIIA